MERFLDRDLENQPLERPGTVRIDWQKRMTFNGSKARFEDSVNVNVNSQLLQTGWLDVYFQHPVSFSDAQPQQPPLVERLSCGDGVFVECRTMKSGQQISYDRIQLPNLKLNNITGEIEVDGPGQIDSVRRGGGGQAFSLPGGPMAGLGGPVAARPVGLGSTPPRASDPNELTCLHLRFLRSISGNKLRKKIVFHGQVVAVNAPAQSWATTLKDDNPATLGPEAFVLRCDNLELNDMSPVSGSNSGNLELIAFDNVVAEKTVYTARGARLTYAQSKDLAILEGDGRSDAELFKQAGPGTQLERYAAQKLSFMIKSGKIISEGTRSLEMNLGPHGMTLPGRK